jgi:hypothetical protein
VKDLSWDALRFSKCQHLSDLGVFRDEKEDRRVEDLRRNVSEEIVVLMNRGTFRGHDGVRQLARMLGEELPEHRS